MVRRVVADVRVQDFQKRRAPSKHYVYIIRVSWSDGSTHTIYRRYSKFFDLQMQLLDEFPVQGGQKDPKQRTIPFLPGKILFRRSHIRDVAIRRLKPIDEYCRTLVLLPPEISHCAEVLQFFEPRAEDLAITKDDAASKKRLASVESISEPLILEQYVAMKEYTRQQNTELSLTVGQLVEVIDKNENGWWFVSGQEEQGWVPATYLEPRDGSQDDLVISNNKPEFYEALQQHIPQDKDEVSLEKGASVEVLQKNMQGWWFVRCHGKEGWAPASYLRPAKEEALSLVADNPSAARRLSEEGAAPTSSASVILGLSTGRSDEDRPATPVVARVAPQQPASESPKFRQRPPPRRNATQPWDVHFPAPPEPPLVEPEYYTIAGFQSSIADGISFTGGQTLEVIEKNLNGWWYVQIGEQEGWAPKSYIDKRKKTGIVRKPSNVNRPRVPPPAPPGDGRLVRDSSLETEDTDLPDWSRRGRRGSNGDTECQSRALSPVRPAPPVKATKKLSPSIVRADFAAGMESNQVKEKSDWKPGSVTGAGDNIDATDKNPLHITSRLPPINRSGCKNDEEPGSAFASKVIGNLINAFVESKSQESTEEEKKDISNVLPCNSSRSKPVIKPRPVRPLSHMAAKQDDGIDISNLRNQLRPTSHRKLLTNDIGHKQRPQDQESNLPCPPPRIQSVLMRNGMGDRSILNYKNNDIADGSRPLCGIMPDGSGETESPEENLKPKLRTSRSREKVEFGSEVPESHNSKHEEAKSVIRPTRPPPPKHSSTAAKAVPSYEPAQCQKSSAAVKETEGLKSVQDLANHLSVQAELKAKVLRPRSAVLLPLAEKTSIHLEQAGRKKCSRPASQSGLGEAESKGNRVMQRGAGDSNGTVLSFNLLHKQDTKEIFIAVGNYEGDDETMSFQEGAMMHVLERDANGWWFCRLLNGQAQEGWVPSNFLQKK
uniref:SH3 and PX domain-containing protein 2B-like n=1 Tax=Myxine glutinosa TaxID=7769 RepID=UPI00358E8D4B